MDARSGRNCAANSRASAGASLMPTRGYSNVSFRHLTQILRVATIRLVRSLVQRRTDGRFVRKKWADEIQIRSEYEQARSGAGGRRDDRRGLRDRRVRAIDDLLVDRSVTDFDIFVGTSAGAIIATFLASGFSPETMFQVIAGQHPDIPSIKRKYIFNFNQREVLRRGLGLPGKLLGTSFGYLRDWQNSTLVDAIWTLTDVLPSGFYDGMALDKYMRLALGAYGSTNRFTDLEREALHHRHQPGYRRARGVWHRRQQRRADLDRGRRLLGAADDL